MEKSLLLNFTLSGVVGYYSLQLKLEKLLCSWSHDGQIIPTVYFYKSYGSLWTKASSLTLPGETENKPANSSLQSLIYQRPPLLQST